MPLLKFSLQVAVASSILFSTTTVCSHKTQISIPSECVINYVTENETNFPYDFSSCINTPSAGYTIQDASNMSYAFTQTQEDIEERNLSITDGYFRLYSRFKRSCFVFHLLTTTFNGTTMAIQNSGFGTSESTIFLIDTKNNDEVITGFQSESNLFDSDLTPFHAPIVFAMNKTILLGLCYHCPPDSKLFTIQINSETGITLADVITTINRANGQGYGKRMEFVSSSADFLEANKFLEEHKGQHGREGLYSAMRVYATQQLFYINLLLLNLNTTMVVTLQNPLNDAPYSHWFLQIRFAEGGFLRIGNEYAITRGNLLIFDNMPAEVVGCDYADNLSSFDLSGVVNIIDVYTWICILLTVLAYAFIYKDMKLGTDLLWPFIGIGFYHSHNRKIIWNYLILISWISLTYQSFISSDALRVSEIPPLKELELKGYKMWVRKASHILGGSSSSIEAAYDMAPEICRKSFTNMFPGRKPHHVLDDGHAGLMEKLGKDDISDALEIISRDKLLIPYGLIVSLWSAMEHNFMYVKDTYLCKSFDLSEIISLKLQYTYRMWSYLSFKLAWMQKQWIEVGIFDRERNFWKVIKWRKFRNYELERADSFRMPHPMRVKSIVGVACLFHCSLGGGILLIYVLTLACFHKKSITLKFETGKECCKMKFVNLFAKALKGLYSLKKLFL
ncbi:unnamed protein product [Orchesella dallaii]|uniref:Uncharacterized protein n=1 Tax=Orchesella dallaii TaxID=48710 RepID=A0ABP1PT33_9HEXA